MDCGGHRGGPTARSVADQHCNSCSATSAPSGSLSPTRRRPSLHFATRRRSGHRTAPEPTIPRLVWGGWGSNPRPRDYESPALTTELPPRKRTTGSHIGDPVCVAPGVGLEPTTYGLTVRRCCQLSYPGSATAQDI